MGAVGVVAGLVILVELEEELEERPEEVDKPEEVDEPEEELEDEEPPLRQEVSPITY